MWHEIFLPGRQGLCTETLFSLFGMSLDFPHFSKVEESVDSRFWTVVTKAGDFEIFPGRPQANFLVWKMPVPVNTKTRMLLTAPCQICPSSLFCDTMVQLGSGFERKKSRCDPPLVFGSAC